MHRVWHIIYCFIFLLMNRSIGAEKLKKFDPVMIKEGELFGEVSYDCEYSGFLEIHTDDILYYCFFVGEDDHNGLLLRKFHIDDMIWGIPVEVLITRKKINLYILTVDYILSKLILIYSFDEKIRITVFNNYMEESVMSEKISINYEILYKANMVSYITYFYKNKKSLCVCGMNRNENILCTFSFDYGLTMKDDHTIEFFLKKKIPLGHYKIQVSFKENEVYFNLHNDLNETNFYELKCVKEQDEYICDIMNRIRETQEYNHKRYKYIPSENNKYYNHHHNGNQQQQQQQRQHQGGVGVGGASSNIGEDENNFIYKHIVRDKYFQMIVFQKDQKCYLAWSFNSLNINDEITKEISSVPCSSVATYHMEERLIVTLKKNNPGPRNHFFLIYEKLTEKAVGCEFGVGGSLYVTKTFMNNTCDMNINNMNVSTNNYDEINFSIIVSSSFHLNQSTCFIWKENVDNKEERSSLYYMEEYNIEKEDIKVYTFYFYKYILINKNFEKSTCTFESNDNQTLYISFRGDTYYKEYNCSILLDTCDFFVHTQSKINITYNDDEWQVGEELYDGFVIYNGVYVSLYDVLSRTNANELIYMDGKENNTNMELNNIKGNNNNNNNSNSNNNNSNSNNNNNSNSNNNNNNNSNSSNNSYGGREKLITIIIPYGIPSTRTIKIEFSNKQNNEEKRWAYLRLQKNKYIIPKVIGINSSDIFDISYKYYKYNQERIKYILNDFSETTYLGFICQTKEEIKKSLCTISLVDHNHKNIGIDNLFKSNKNILPFLYYQSTPRKIQPYNQIISEFRFVVFKNFDIFLQDKKISYILLKCICSPSSSLINTQKNIDLTYLITNEQVSHDFIHTPGILIRQRINNSQNNNKNNNMNVNKNSNYSIHNNNENIRRTKRKNNDTQNDKQDQLPSYDFNDLYNEKKNSASLFDFNFVLFLFFCITLF
ncbi:6-cysteine protein [Plasmodium gaboni]|uniref:6-cysteine protein n=1 Tax=Plasmodium gaboni TaxID=647221 RepID=A0ABY1UHS5_9APIC|nr:6-cysteine protein [Plasmodium gaboni]